MSDAGVEGGRQRQSAEPLDRLCIGGHRPGHATGQRPGAAERIDGLAVPQEHVAGGRSRCGLAAVEADQPAIGEPHEHEAPSADAGVVAVDDAEREAGGDRGIDRIAAAGEGVERGLGRERMHGRGEPGGAGLDGGGPRTGGWFGRGGERTHGGDPGSEHGCEQGRQSKQHACGAPGNDLEDSDATGESRAMRDSPSEGVQLSLC